MTPEELHDAIVRAIYDAIPDDDPGDPKPPLHDHCALPWMERDADAVLAVVTPALAQARADGAREALDAFVLYAGSVATRVESKAARARWEHAAAVVQDWAIDYRPEKEQSDG